MAQNSSLVPASLGARLGAFLIDCLFVGWPFLLVGGLQMAVEAKALSLDEELLQKMISGGLSLTGLLILVNIFLALQNGQSLGKRSQKLHLVDMDGQPLGAGKRIARSFWTALLLALSALGTSLLDFCFMAFRSDRRALHDVLAGSQVLATAPELAVGESGSQSGLEIDEQGNVVSLPTGWSPIEKAPTLFTLNFVGTTLTGGRPVEPSGKILCGTQVFIFALIPLFGLRRFLYSDLGGNRYQFFASAPVTAGWATWNAAMGLALPLCFVCALILGKIG